MSAASLLPRRLGTLLIACALGACTATPERASPPAVAKEAPAKEAPAVASKPAPPPAATPKPKPVAPPVKEVEPPPAPVVTATDTLRKAVQAYDDGGYGEAGRLFALALEQGLASPADQAGAHKHLAFIACVANRIAACRAEFRKAFEVHPGFDLAPAEAGHPIWGPVFRSVKAEVARRKRAASPPKPASGSAARPSPSAPSSPSR